MIRTVPKPSSLLPGGVGGHLPQDAARRRAIERMAQSVFHLWGYQEIIPPMFEYLDVLEKGLSRELVEKSYKFVNRSNGRVMILRPDVTPQVARMVAQLMSRQPQPIRLCYSANVFRYEDEHAGRDREILQIGAELVGPQDADADAEMIALVVEVLRSLGLRRFRIALGHVGFVQSLLEAFGLKEAKRLQIQETLASRNTTRLSHLIGQVKSAPPELGRLVQILDLLGQEEVFEKAGKLLKACAVDTRCSDQALSRLREVYQKAKQYGIGRFLMLDLAEVRGFDYYSGMVFEVFSEEVGYELGGGGRYDELISRFGRGMPSTGFALHVERLQQALAPTRPEVSGVQAEILLIDCCLEESGAGIRLMQALRQQGRSVLRVKSSRLGADGCVNASRHLRAEVAIVIGPQKDSRSGRGDSDTQQVTWWHLKSGRKRKIRVAQLFKELDRLSVRPAVSR